MAAPQIDAVASFTYLTDNIPSWLEQLAALTKRTTEKHAEFVAEYTSVLTQIKRNPKRVKSPSLQSIHSKGDQSIDVPQVDPPNEDTLPQPPDPIDINPLEAGTKYLYAQAQKKRKPNSSIRSGASGPQKYRSKHQVIIYYDAHVQNELDAMVKAVGVARNNLRKGRNALNASRGFQLPTLSRKLDPFSLSPSLESIRAQAISRSSPALSGKYGLSTSSQGPANGDEACFTDTDKMLETIQGLYETAAHQFLRDGDCKKELETAKDELNTVLEKAKPTVEALKEKAKTDEEAGKQEADDSDSEITLCNKPSTEQLKIVSSKTTPSVLQTLDDVKTRNILPPPVEPLPTAGMTIEVDDDASDDGSVGEIDISQFRMTNARRLRT